MEEDLKAFRRIIEISIEELTDMAFGGNIQRRHHLEDAVGCFAYIGLLIEAEKTVLELFQDAEVDPGDATHSNTRT